MIIMASGCKVIDRRFISDHVKLENTYKYNHFYVFLTTTAIFLCKIFIDNY